MLKKIQRNNEEENTEYWSFRISHKELKKKNKQSNVKEKKKLKQKKNSVICVGNHRSVLQ